MKIICLFLLAAKIWQLDATATLEITFTSFTNPGGKCADGSNCDIWPGGECDHRFYFGLDQQNGNMNDAKSDSIMMKVTSVFINENTNYFPTNQKVNGVDNPIQQSFTSWPGAVLFKVYIEDVDLDAPDNVDSIVHRLQMQPAQSRDASSPVSLSLKGLRTSASKTTLEITVRLYCDANYFGSNCDIECVSKNNDYGHYTCDPATGAILCRPGWEDVSTQCTIFSDDCVGNRCQNNAICVDANRNYTCSCLPGFTGRFCETNINDCLNSPCKNGADCTDLINDFSCNCPNTFVGKTCNTTSCTQNSPCRNGGTCYGQLNCYCTRGFTDPTCSTPTCKVIPCKNGGVCGADGLCVCPLGTTGDQCEILLCDIMAAYCRNGAMCSKGKCVCPLGFEGELCEQNQMCKTVTCQHNGTCIPEMTAGGWGVRCLCISPYSGERCEKSGVSQLNEQPANLFKPSSQYEFLTYTEGKLMLAFAILSFILLVIVIILSICLCLSRRRSSSNSETTRVEKSEISILSTNAPPIPSSPPPKYFSDLKSDNCANHYETDDVMGSSKMTSQEESPYATLDDNVINVKVMEKITYPFSTITESVSPDDTC